MGRPRGRTGRPPGSTFTPTKKEANVPNINTLPGEDVFYLDCRVLPREDLDEVMSEIRSICDGVQRDFGVQVEVQPVQRASSPPTPAEAPIVGTLARAIRDVYGVEARTVGVGGGTARSRPRRGPGRRRRRPPRASGDGGGTT